jgi:hypothetical protein
VEPYHRCGIAITWVFFSNPEVFNSSYHGIIRRSPDYEHDPKKEEEEEEVIYEEEFFGYGHGFKKGQISSPYI